MKDFPFFTTQNGAAGLTLQEIPYNKSAYITIHDTRNLTALLQECVDFCRAVGAESIYACNHKDLCKYPVYARILEMTCRRCELPQTDAVALGVTQETLQQFVQIYNDKMKDIPAAKYLTGQRAQMLLREGSCYFVFCDDSLLGIGIAAKSEIFAIASIQPGSGAAIVSALCSVLTGAQLHLEVAQENHKACRLYESLGFSFSEEKNIWYKIY